MTPYKRGDRVKTLRAKQAIIPRRGRLGTARYIPIGSFGRVECDIDANTVAVSVGGMLGTLTYKRSELQPFVVS